MFGSKSKAHETSISPVLNITYSINKVGNRFFFKQYTTLLKEPIVREINDTSNIIGYGKKKYTDAYLQYFQEFVKGGFVWQRQGERVDVDCQLRRPQPC